MRSPEIVSAIGADQLRKAEVYATVVEVLPYEEPSDTSLHEADHAVVGEVDGAHAEFITITRKCSHF